jgi:predicted nucleic acid-binding protein
MRARGFGSNRSAFGASADAEPLAATALLRGARGVTRNVVRFNPLPILVARPEP